MKIILLVMLLLSVSYTTTAQITAIPDPAFEQELIDQSIDSDGVVNGQVLTVDVENITELSIDVNYQLTDVTGIQSFSNLEQLTINFTELTYIDLSQNAKLQKVNCMNNLLESITLPSSELLEELYVGNVSDLGPWNVLEQIDLSNNINIRIVGADMLPTLDLLNLRNGNNNPDMSINVAMWGGDGPANPNAVDNIVCIQVDDEELALTNQPPYSEWNVYHPEAAFSYSENCALSTPDFGEDQKISVYPNPASDTIYFNLPDGTSVDKVVLYDMSGRMVKEDDVISGNTISLFGLAKGIYIVQLFSVAAMQTEKVTIK